MDLVEKLKDAVAGTNLYSALHGVVKLKEISEDACYPIIIEYNKGRVASYTREGKYRHDCDGECLLFPSKECRDWSKFNTYKSGDILANDDGRAFILRGFNPEGYPIAYCGIDSLDDFMVVNNFSIWSKTPFRKATQEEVNTLMEAMKEKGYIWSVTDKLLRRDLPVNTLCVVGDQPHSAFKFHQMDIRRYAGNHECFVHAGSSECHDSTVAWRHIIPLDKLIVDAEGTVITDKKYDYGTSNRYV